MVAIPAAQRFSTNYAGGEATTAGGLSDGDRELLDNVLEEFLEGGIATTTDVAAVVGDAPANRNTLGEISDELDGQRRKFVILAVGQSNMQVNSAYAWTPPDNLDIWDWDGTEDDVGSAFNPVSGTTMSYSRAFGAEIARLHPLLDVNIVNLALGGKTIDKWSGDIKYIWSASTANSDPGATFVRVNNASLALATTLYVSETDGESYSRIAAFTNADSADWIRIEKYDNPAIYAEYDVGVRTDNGTWQTIALTYTGGSGSLSASDEVRVRIGPDMYQIIDSNLPPALASLGATMPDVVLWWQAESDTESGVGGYYETSYERVIARLRTDGHISQSTPIIMSGIVSNEYSGVPAYGIVNRMLQRVAMAEPDVRTFVYPASLPIELWDETVTFHLHMHPEGYEEAGKRAAHAYLTGTGRKSMSGISYDFNNERVSVESETFASSLPAPFVPTWMLEGESGANQLVRRASNTGAPDFQLARSRGTLAARTALEQNDIIGNLDFAGYGGALHITSARISAQVIQPTPLDTAMGTQVSIQAAALGAATLSTVATFSVASGLVMGGVASIDISGHIVARSYTIATLPAAASYQRRLIYCSDLGGVGGLLYSDGTLWYRFDPGGYATLATDADFTLTPLASARVMKHTGTLTADRTVTLATTNVYTGAEFLITRTGGGAFNLNVVGPGLLKALATPTWGIFKYGGGAWYLAAHGSFDGATVGGAPANRDTLGKLSTVLWQRGLVVPTLADLAALSADDLPLGRMAGLHYGSAFGGYGDADFVILDGDAAANGLTADGTVVVENDDGDRTLVRKRWKDQGEVDLLWYSPSLDGTSNSYTQAALWIAAVKALAPAQGRSIGIIPAINKPFLIGTTLSLTGAAGIKLAGGGVLKRHSALPGTSNLFSAAGAPGADTYANSDIIIEDLTFDGADVDAANADTFQNLCRLFSVDGLKIRRCTFENWQRNMVVLFGCRNAVIDDNDFSDWALNQSGASLDGGSAIFVGLNSGDTTTSKDVRITGNRFRDGRWTAISCYATGYTITENDIRDVQECGIFIRSDAGGGDARRGIVAKNQVHGVTTNYIDATGIVGSGGDLSIEGNLVEDCEAQGIGVNDGGTDVSVLDNHVKNCVSDAVTYSGIGQITLRLVTGGVASSNLVVRGNKVEGALAPYGMRVFHASGAETIDDVTIAYNELQGSASSAANYLAIEASMIGARWLVTKNQPDQNEYGISRMTLTDGVTAPATILGQAQIYVDTADGNLRIKYGDGETKVVGSKDDIQRFTSTSTWTKPAGAKNVRVIAIGPGGGGGGGSKIGAGTAVSGGGGGGGGARVEATFEAADLPDTAITCTITAGATGGAGATVNGAGATGGAVNGSGTGFGTGTYLVIAHSGASGSSTAAGTASAGGGGGGSVTAGGIAAGATAGAAGIVGGSAGGSGAVGVVNTAQGGAGGAGTPAAGTLGLTGGRCFYGGGGGASGGGITVGNATSAGGVAVDSNSTTGTAGAAGAGAGGGNGGTTTRNLKMIGGGGGGGGGSDTTGVGGNGGAGQIPGGGGGGGGCTQTGANAGNGGDGARGEIVVITSF